MRNAGRASVCVWAIVAAGLLAPGASWGQTGDGSIVGWGSQVVGVDLSGDFVGVAGGGTHSLGLKSDGSIVAWGRNDCSQCDVPAPNTRFVAVAGGEVHSLGLKDDGSIVAWGCNNCGQCELAAPNADFVAVSAGGYHSLGLKADGSIAAWGWNDDGQCDVPAPNADFVAIAGGYYHSLGLKSDGSIVAWGNNDYGQCNVPTPNADLVAIAGGYLHSLGLKSDGSIVAWGNNNDGQCNVPAPNGDFVAIAAGQYHSLGLKANGSIVAWGNNDYGQCSVPAPNAEFVAVAGGAFHSLGLKSDGSIVVWGWNEFGQCSVPAPNGDFVAVAGGAFHSLGLKADGTIVAWGWNDYGQCTVPGPNADFVAVAGGASHSLGLKADGTIVAWGWNDYGQCTVPGPNADFVAIAAGWEHSLGLKAFGSIVAWGNNSAGQCEVPAPNGEFVGVGAGVAHSLGLKADGSIAAWGWNDDGQCNVAAPNTGFVAVAGGGEHSLGLKAGGPIAAWGNNGFGQCNVLIPNADFVAVAGGYYHSLGLKADGSIVAWGQTEYGECNVPAPNADFVGVAGGQYCSLGLKGGGQSGSAGLTGGVHDSVTGAAVAGATVAVLGRTPVQTGAQGQFSFEQLPAGTTTIHVSRQEYFSTSRTVHATAGSTTTVNILLTPLPTSHGVAEVRGHYCGPGRRAYYLDGVVLYETFIATINWGSQTPGSVRWSTPYVTFTDPCPGTSASRTFDMGSDFGPLGTLTVTAISGDEPPVESEPYAVNLRVIPPPPIIEWFWSDYVAVPSGQEVEYRLLGFTGVQIDLATWAASNIETSFPLFGGHELKIGLELERDASPVSATLVGTVGSDGTATLFSFGWDDEYNKYTRRHVRCRKGIKLPYFEAAPSVSFSLNAAWADDARMWLPGGEVEVGCDLMWSSPQIPLGMVLIVPIYTRGEYTLDLNLSLELETTSLEGPDWSGSFAFEPLAKGVLGAGVAGAACVEGYLGGGFHAGVEFLPEFEWINPYVILVGGVQATLGPFTVGPLELRYAWPEQEVSGGLSPSQILQRAPWVLLPRAYLKAPDDEDWSRRCAGRKSRGVTEQSILTTVFPYSTPDVCRTGDDVLAVWIADNTQRDLINRTELRFVRGEHNAGPPSTWSWSPPAAVAGDGTADMNPRLISLPGGDAACIWQDARTVLSDTDPIEVFLSNLEITVAMYDADSRTWSPATRLTGNGVLDRSPNIAGQTADDLLAVWVANVGNDLWGSVTAPNRFMWAAYDGAAWSPPAGIASGFGMILDTTLAYDGASGTFVFAVDGDDNLDTAEDQELWAATYSGGAWSAPVPLTDDGPRPAGPRFDHGGLGEQLTAGISDANPQLVYDASGTLRLAWLRGGALCVATGTDVANAAVVATPGESMGSRDFELVASDSGRLALVWNDVSETYHDLWVSYYEPTQAAWSQPRQLTFDDAAERFVAGVFAANDDLVCVYDKTWTVYEDREEEVNGQVVVVEDVPQAGPSDLYYLHYHLGLDLAVTVEDFNVTPPNPLPGTQATLTATIKNIGESPAANVQVGFYEGDPDAGGTLIDLAVIAGPVVGGDDADVSVTWPVPSSTGPRPLYVRVDPALQQEDRDRLNNTASFNVFAPDLTISEIGVLAAGPDRLLTIRVANEGVLTTPATEVVLRKRSPTGPVLATLSAPAIVPGAYYDLSYRWESPPAALDGVATLYATVDETGAIDEFDESNNVRSALVPVPRPARETTNVNGAANPGVPQHAPPP